tara:strand:+ start:82 stop:486 length:405 start_codon:yes stop_codon:yes gene_type:complete
MTKTKQIVIQALFASAMGSAVTTTSSSTPYTADTYDVNLGCAQCIRSGFKYLAPALRSLIPTGASHGGECCDGSTNSGCTALDGSDTLASGFVRVNPTGVDIDLAVHSCPTEEKFCGGRKEVSFTDPSDADVTL